MLKRDKKAEFLEVGIVSMKYQFVPAPVPARMYVASPCAGTDGGSRTDSSDKFGV